MSQHNKVAIYSGEGGVAAIVVASPKAIAKYGEAAVFGAAVPAGTPYEVVGRSEVDAMYAEAGLFRDAWEVEIDSPILQGAVVDTPAEMGA